MVQSTIAYALAARAHGRDGRVLSTPDTVERMRSAAASFGEASRGALAGPTGLAGDGTLVVLLASPDGVLPAARVIAASVRPARTTFCAARSEFPTSASSREAVEPAILVSDRALSVAAERIEETDFRQARFLVVGPSPGELVGTLIGLILESYDSMTDRQTQIVELLRESETQQQVATHLGVSRQAVNQSLTAAGWPHIERAEKIARRELAALWNRQEGEKSRGGER
ncbi:MAG: hypothetical protein GF400_11575 [Candidatus Eisenbacteria bacterium]|nr:hypothetical protein [Candidatus Eisenbacteria bacterium]